VHLLSPGPLELARSDAQRGFGIAANIVQSQLRQPWMCSLVVVDPALTCGLRRFYSDTGRDALNSAGRTLRSVRANPDRNGLLPGRLSDALRGVDADRRAKARKTHGRAATWRLPVFWEGLSLANAGWGGPLASRSPVEGVFRRKGAVCAASPRMHGVNIRALRERDPPIAGAALARYTPSCRDVTGRRASADDGVVWVRKLTQPFETRRSATGVAPEPLSLN